MAKKRNKAIPRIDFKELTPQVLIKPSKTNPKYEKAYLSRESKTEDPFSLNTSTWD